MSIHINLNLTSDFKLHILIYDRGYTMYNIAIKKIN